MRTHFLVLALTLSSCQQSEQESSIRSAGDEQSLIEKASCKEGFESFKANVFSAVQESTCVRCHSGNNSRAPAWASKTQEDAYQRMMDYIDFSNVSNSKLVIRSANGHCDTPNDNSCSQPETQAKLTDAINQWWSKGQSNCSLTQYKKTAAVKIPDGLTDQSFKTITWDVGSIDSQWNGIQITAEMGAIVSGADKVGYVIRKPRIVAKSGIGFIKIKDLRIFVNQKYAEYVNVFERIDAEVGPVKNTANQNVYPVLSAETVTITSRTVDTDSLSIGIGSIELIQAPKCKADDEFKKSVEPNLALFKCASCHTNNAATSPIPAMPATTPELCATLRQYVWPSQTIPAPLFEVPIFAKKLSHPDVANLRRGVVNSGMQSWVKAEF